MNSTYEIKFQNGELYHHGIKGQKWGVRRFQNEDGSLTPAGEKRYLTNATDSDIRNDKHSLIEKYSNEDPRMKEVNKYESQAYKLAEMYMDLLKKVPA